VEQKIPPPAESGPASSLASVGVAREDGQNSSRVRLRAAGNDLLDSDVGAAEYSLFEVLSAEMKSTSVTQVTLQEFKVLDVLSTRPVTWVDAPLSWGFGLDWQQGWRVPVKIGYGFDSDKEQHARLLFFMTGEIQENVLNRRFFTPGAESLLMFHINTRFRGWVADDQDISGRHNQLSGGLAYDLRPSLQLRYEKQDAHKISLGFYF
jgi:hypothetical protein